MNTWRNMLSRGLIGGIVIVAIALGAGVVARVYAASADHAVALTPDQLTTVQNLSGAFKAVERAVGPSVVNIRVARTVPAGNALPFDQQMFKRFFRDFPDMMPNLSPEFQQKGRSFHEIGTGSGVIIEASGGTGYILTNNHVAGGAKEMDVTLADGRQIKNATLVGADPGTDLAVIEIKADNLLPARWGSSNELQPGDWVLAFGSPFGYVGSMTHGIVSALHRQAGILGQYGHEDFIQTDAPINPGNSGGPLVNVRGEVVGINIAIATHSGGFQGIGFAIPSNEARRVYGVLKEHHKVQRGWLGLQIVDVAKALDEARSAGYQGHTGILVKGVLSNSPSTGKLQPGDVITTLNGKAVTNVEDLRNTVAMAAPGTEVKLQVMRDGKQQELTVKLGEQPSAPGLASAEKPEQRKFGMQLSDLTPELAKQYGAKAGALVTSIEPGSQAAESGVHVGDVITQIDTQKVTNAHEAAAALAKVDLSKGVRLYITNQSGSELLYAQASK